MGENGNVWSLSRNRLSKSTLSPYMAINWAPEQALLSTSKQRIGGSSRQASYTRNGGEHGELSSAAGRAVRRHREMSKILAGGSSRALIAGLIGTGACADLRAT